MGGYKFGNLKFAGHLKMTYIYQCFPIKYGIHIGAKQVINTVLMFPEVTSIRMGRHPVIPYVKVFSVYPKLMVILTFCFSFM